MKRVPLLLASLSLLLLPMCKTVPDDVGLPTVCEAIATSRVAVGASRDTAAAVFGIATYSTFSEQPNRHVPDATDRIHTLTFDTGEVVIHEARTIERELLSSISATRRNAPVPLGSYIGRTRAQIVTAIGAPESESGASATWSCETEAGPEQLTLIFAEGVVTRASAAYYVD